jgi:hypothetical protein
VVDLVDVRTMVEQQLDNPSQAGSPRRGRAEERRMARARQRPSPNPRKLARDERRVQFERGRDFLGVPEDECHLEPGVRKGRVSCEQLLGNIRPAVQRCAHQSRTPLLAVADRRLFVVDQRRP